MIGKTTKSVRASKATTADAKKVFAKDKPVPKGERQPKDLKQSLATALPDGLMFTQLDRNQQVRLNVVGGRTKVVVVALGTVLDAYAASEFLLSLPSLGLFCILSLTNECPCSCLLP